MKVIKTYEEWESLVKTKKKDICIMLCNGAKEHFASFEKAFTVGVVMTEDGDLSIGGDEEECVAYARFSLANYGYPDVYIDEYEFELFARECDEYEDAKRCAEESGMSLISYVLKSSRDSELYKIFKKLEYIKSKDLFMKDCWKNEFNGIWDFLNRKRAALAK